MKTTWTTPRKPTLKQALCMTALALALTGCATVEGIGNDISGGARKVSNWF
jgi:predicted small secreted protein